MPEMVQIGNEVRNGMMWPLGRLPDNWDNFAKLSVQRIRHPLRRHRVLLLPLVARHPAGAA